MIPAMMLVAVTLAQAPSSPSTSRIDPLVLLGIYPGPRITGPNDLRVVLKNESSDTVMALMSIRIESPSRGAQQSHYHSLGPGETISWTEQYRVPNRAYRLLRVFVGVASARPSKAEPYPWFADEYETSRFALHPAGASDGAAPESAPQAWRYYWDLGPSVERLADRIRTIADSLQTYPDETKAALRRLLRWDRPAPIDFSPHLVSSDTLGPYSIRLMQISGESGEPINFQLLRRGTFDGPRSTVLYLSGNPPGTKESGTVPAMILADQHLQVVSIDRRGTARETGYGEFLANIADPVFDARRLIDYLVTREDLTKGISVFGFSMGAYEGMFLTALHPHVTAAVLASRMVDHDSLFASSAWAPTLWSPEVLEDVGLGEFDGDWKHLMEAAALVGDQAAAAFRKRYSFFDQINPRAVLPLAAPRPILILTGAQDSQFALPGVMSVDRAVRRRYTDLGVQSASQLYIMPRIGHGLGPVGLDHAAEWLRLWAGMRNRMTR